MKAKKNIIIPKGYKSPGSIKETEIAIKDVKDYFERALAKELNLTRVSAPLFVAFTVLIKSNRVASKTRSFLGIGYFLARCSLRRTFPSNSFRISFASLLPR